jgi:isopentenyl diphosphate isomerase/L-lactate dehydrogenase-like FMN-dependent dehydrogenase
LSTVSEPPPFADYQFEIYLAGLQGDVPEYPISVAELERKAAEVMTPEALGYVAGGAGAEHTVRANRDGFDRWRIVPRMLRDIGRRDLSVELFGQRLPAPVLLGPVGVQSIVHDDAETATATAAASTGIPMILSTASSTTMEEVAAANGASRRWFQLYWPSDRELATSFIQRAEASGYEALVVTLDTWLLAWRPRDLSLAYLPFLKSIGIANYLSDPVFRAALDAPPEADPQAAILHFVRVFSDPTVTWEDLAFLRDATKMPILLKGILHPDDARRAIDHGMDGIIVSNHGGRQVDGAIATIDALPAIVSALDGAVPILMDGGIRSASDAFKALALGADTVLLGRLYMWALAVGGEAGVRALLRGFLAELDLTLALSGYRSFGEVDSSALVRDS